MAIVVDGKNLAREILGEIRVEVSTTKKKLRLASILVGEDPASLSFLREKERAAREAGIDFRLYRFPEDITTAKLRSRLAKIVHLTQNSGVILQLPLPKHLNTQYLLNAITPQKDVDCLSERLLGAFLAERSKIMPPPVAALKFLLEKREVQVKGKVAAVVGIGTLVGRAAVIWLMQQGATVLMLNEYTHDLAHFTRQAEIIISGVGKPNLISGNMVREGAAVFDFGFSKIGDKIAGDVDFDEVSKKASLITPVPGGMGPLTVAFLLNNLLVLNAKQK